MLGLVLHNVAIERRRPQIYTGSDFVRDVAIANTAAMTAAGEAGQELLNQWESQVADMGDCEPESLLARRNSVSILVFDT